MNPVSEDEARRACERLCEAYGHHADVGESELFAELFVPDGVFDRLGSPFKGREQIRGFLDGRPSDIWQRHRFSGFTFQLGEDGRSATGTLDLTLERGKLGETEISETVHARYHDQFVLTDAGWKFKRRAISLLEQPV